MRAIVAGALAALGGVSFSCGRVHDQLEGTYDFAAVEVLRDECGLLQDPAAVWAADLFISGHVVRMRSRPGAATSPPDYRQYDLPLAGAYRADLEEFEVDGSAGNVVAILPGGQECLLDLLTLHLEAVTDTPSTFHGTLAVRYEADLPDICACQLWTTYRATRR